MKEKFLGIIQGLIKTSDIEEFVSLLRQKSDYIKKQPLDFLLMSKNDITAMFNLLKDCLQKHTFVPKHTIIALFLLLSYFITKRIKKFSILKENIDSDLLIGFCIYLVEKDIQRYLDLKGGSK